jgi:predicted nuclease of restriction endonuclease-like (RecB) superfamily
MISYSKIDAYRSVNRELIALFYYIGKFASEQIQAANWSRSDVAEFASLAQSHQLGKLCFTASNIWRMKEFYEIYSPSLVLWQTILDVSWTNHLVIMEHTISEDERAFYLFLAIRNQYSEVELEQAIDESLFEQTKFFGISINSLLKKSKSRTSLSTKLLFESFAACEQATKEEVK